jgi:hypothetical protein
VLGVFMQTAPLSEPISAPGMAIPTYLIPEPAA